MSWVIVWDDSVIKISDTICMQNIWPGLKLLVGVLPIENLIFRAKFLTGSASLSIVFSIIGVALELWLYFWGILTDFLRFAAL